MPTLTYTGTIALEGNFRTLSVAGNIIAPSEWFTARSRGFFLRLIQIYPTDASTALSGRTRLYFASTSTENPLTAGPELLPAVEAGLRITLSSGGRSVVIDGTGTDTTEPYNWVPSNAAEVGAFAARLSRGSSLTVTLTYPVNAPPVANAGPDQTVAAGSTVQLAGSGTDPDVGDTIASYAWTQDGTPAVSLSDAAIRNPTFDAPALATNAAPVVLNLDLVVTDNNGAASPKNRVQITVKPTTVEGYQRGTVAPAAPANSVEDLPNGWATDQPSPTTTENVYRLRGVRTYRSGAFVSTAWTVTKVADMVPPLALTDFPRTGLAFEMLALLPRSRSDDFIYATSERGGTDVPAAGDANLGTDDTKITRIRWDGTQLRFQDNNVPQPLNIGTFFATGGDGADLTLQVMSQDRSRGAQSIASMTVQSSGDNFINFAPSDSALVAALNKVRAGSDNYILALTRPHTGPPPNQRPVADAGDPQTIQSGAAFSLDGSGSSDPDTDDTLTYAWTQDSGTITALTDANTATPDGTAPVLARGAADVVLVYRLIVTDNHGLASLADTVAITVQAPPNRRPVADAGDPQTVNAGAAFMLDGSGSSDPDGNPITYAWTQSSGLITPLTNANTATPSGTAPPLEVGDDDVEVVYSLIVTDSHGRSSLADTVTVTVTAPVPTPIRLRPAVVSHFHYCPESDFLAFTPRMVGSTDDADYPVSRLANYHRPDLAFRPNDPAGALTVRATLDQATTIAAAVLLDPTWETTNGLTLGGSDLDVQINPIDQRRVAFAAHDPDHPPGTALDLVVPANAPIEGDNAALGTLILCKEWNRLGTNPQNPIIRRRVIEEPENYCTIEEDWTILVHSPEEFARWHKIRREWEQLYLWHEIGRGTAPRIMLAYLTRPPDVPLAPGGEAEVNCTWRTLPAPIRSLP